MRLTHRILWLAGALPVFAGPAHAAEPAAPCIDNAEEAVVRFVEAGATRPADAPALLRRSSLKQFRARLEQLLDSRYSPASAALREHLFGTDPASARIESMTDEALVSRYLSARTAVVEISELTVLKHESSRVFGDEVTVSYQVRQGATSQTLQRKFSAFREGTCWRVDVPVIAWAQLELMSKTLKNARTEQYSMRQAPSTVSLLVSPASDDERPDMRQIWYRGSSGKRFPIWIANTPLLTEADVSAATATWDCDGGLGPERAAVKIRFADASSERLKAWSHDNVGQMLAVVVDGEAWVFARVLTGLSNQLAVCSLDASLDEAQTLAQRLMGAPTAPRPPENAP